MADIIPETVVETKSGKALLPLSKLSGKPKDRVSELVKSHLDNLFREANKFKPGRKTFLNIMQLKVSKDC